MTYRRTGALALLLLFFQVATANAVPCGVQCALGTGTEAHQHDGAGPSPDASSHMQTAVTPGSSCGNVQLLVVGFVAPAFPTAPVMTAGPTAQAVAGAPLAFSHVRPLDTPPPRVPAQLTA